MSLFKTKYKKRLENIDTIAEAIIFDYTLMLEKAEDEDDYAFIEGLIEGTQYLLRQIKETEDNEQYII